jgi:hypothetical protein
MTRIIEWFFLYCIVSSTAVAEELNSQIILDKEKSFYAFLEPDIKQQYEAAVASAMAHLKETGKLNIMPKHEIDNAFDFIKSDFYNKAAMQAMCIGETLRSLGSYDPTAKTFQDNVMVRAKSCFEAKMVDFQVWNNLIVNYFNVMPPGTSKRCEMEARLFERELQLPPYDFLKTKNPMLIDFAKYNQCIRSTH